MSGDEGGAASAAAAQTVAQVETSVGGAGDLSPGALRRPLTDAEQAMVAAAWNHNDESGTVVCSLPAGAGGSSVDILGKHFGRMRNAWLFDESVNAYMFLLQERDNDWAPKHGAKPSHFMSSFFFEKVRRARVVVNHWNHAIHKSHFMNFFFSEKVSVQERAF